MDANKILEIAAELMDDDVREEIHAEGKCTTAEEFLREYEQRHREKYGEDFSI